jgi:hypothetical protein
VKISSLLTEFSELYYYLTQKLTHVKEHNISTRANEQYLNLLKFAA